MFVPCAIVAAVLVGCTPTPGGTHPSPNATTETPAPIVTGAAADVAVPKPVLDIDCGGLAGAPAITAAFGASVHTVDPLVTQALMTTTVPDAYVLQTLGGITCEWNNGVPFDGVPGPTPYVGAQLAILPHAEVQWATYLRNYEEAGIFCPTSSPQLYCESEQLVGTTWVSLVMQGVVSEAQARSLATSINAVVSAAGPGAPAWTPPSGTGTFGDCASLLTPAQAEADMHVTGSTIFFDQPRGGWSIQAGARVNADAVGCLLKFTDEDSVPGVVEWLRGGEWAYDAFAAFDAYPWGTNAPVAIAGLPSGDRARIRCTDPTSPDYERQPICTVDMVLGGNWIQVVYEPADGDHAGAEPRAGALALAADVVAGYTRAVG
ncbi:MAG: hypothetical protein ABJA11_03455 [Pseudolysinimonas sp.]